jgi:outer membrane protein OmpA-like peptidoglycan-associated protein
MKFLRTLGVVGLGALLGGCDQVGSAVDQANDAKDKASACAEATGLANLNPNLDPAQLAAQAQQKSDRLRALAGQVADQDLKQNLVTIADSYVSLEQRKADRLSNVNDWLQRNATNLENLRSACF